MIGIDLARAGALVGMMATHLLGRIDVYGDPTPVALVAGKAAALFAVLAGFSVVLSTRRYDRWRDAALSLVVRGVLIAVLGFVLGSLSGSIAVVLVHYGALFLLAPLFLRMPSRWLVPLTAVWVVAAPALSHLLRGRWGLVRDGGSPGLESLSAPVELVQDVVLTGYYPVLAWLGYLLVGVLLARLDWSRIDVAIRALIGGVLAAAAAWIVSQLLLAAGGVEAIERASAGRGPMDWGSLYAARWIGSYGVTPTDTWWWLVVSGPHSSTTFDLVYTSGIAVAVIAACVLLCRALGERTRLLMPVLAAGSMPLTLYTLHVVMTGFMELFVLQVILLLALAALWRVSIEGPGPLESLVSGAVKAVVPRR